MTRRSLAKCGEAFAWSRSDLPLSVVACTWRCGNCLLRSPGMIELTKNPCFTCVSYLIHSLLTVLSDIRRCKYPHVRVRFFFGSHYQAFSKASWDIILSVIAQADTLGCGLQLQLEAWVGIWFTSLYAKNVEETDFRLEAFSPTLTFDRKYKTSLKL